MHAGSGEVLYLPDDFGEIAAGPWVVARVDEMVLLSRLGENEDGRLCMTCRYVRVRPEELARFVPIRLRIASPIQRMEQPISLST
ncbi:MAG TPA: hypothetical protein VFA07_18135 [Chthonomonadaceae bacterium]|nr:hypothetical protein [Chthonomonadaceae bacterium]